MSAPPAPRTLVRPAVVPRRIDFLEWVRGVAAVLVVIEHTVERLAPSWFPQMVSIVDPGRVGVVAFFLVSGYIIPLSFERQDVRTFLVRRLLRLYPLYWFLLVAQLLLLALHGQLEGATTAPGLVVLLLNIAMLHGLLGLPSIIGPAWTLSIEWVFYWQQMAAKRARRLEAGWTLGYGWLLAYVGLCLTERGTARDLPTTLPMLLAVSCLGHAWCRWDQHRLTTRRFTALLVAQVVLVPAGAAVGVDSWTPVRYAISFLGGLLFFATAYLLRHRRSPTTLVWLGSISFAVYLSHTLVLRLCDSVLELPVPLTAMACLVLVPAFGHLLHHRLEQPFIRMARRRTTATSVEGAGTSVRCSNASATGHSA